MTERTRYEPILDGRVRADPLETQGWSTYWVAGSALQEGRFDEAAELGRFTIEESREARELYPVFLERARDFMTREGVPKEELDRVEALVLREIRLPDGTEFDLEAGWRSFEEAIGGFEGACGAEDLPNALRYLDSARNIWRLTHDRACDWVCGVVDTCAGLLGEERIGELWDHMLADLYPTRDRYAADARPWHDSMRALVLDAATSLRGHMSGPDREGDVKVWEEEDRWVLRFDPCGSGGRMFRRDPEAKSAPEEPPHGVTTARYDWAWNEEGVCYYCVHCCQLQERVPIERLGYPLRVVEPPLWPPSKGRRHCTWSIYKDPSLVPDEAYGRVGAPPPAGRTHADR